MEFGFFKKRKKHREIENEKVFKGDLASLNGGDVNNAAQQGTNGEPAENIITPFDDTSDSYVFMSFVNVRKGRWICTECGTYNDETMSGCVVCGLPKPRG